jgi:hypothetical protein
MKMNTKGEGGQICSMYFVYVYENRIRKTGEIILGQRDEGE